MTFQYSFEPLTSCPVCGGANYAQSRSCEDRGLRLTYSKCNDCGHIFLNPRMTDACTADFYGSGTARDQIGGINERETYWQKTRSEQQIKVMGQYLTGLKTSLEIGCAAGMLMWCLRKIGFTLSVGVEADTRFHKVEPACHFPVYADISLVPHYQPFDLIAMCHVLEHINHPLEYMRALLDKRAHKGTRLLIEIPDCRDPFSYQLHHVSVFTDDTLTGFFKRLGYRPLKFYHYGKLGVKRMCVIVMLERIPTR